MEPYKIVVVQELNEKDDKTTDSGIARGGKGDIMPRALLIRVPNNLKTKNFWNILVFSNGEGR